jgi:hypothetical protein
MSNENPLWGAPRIHGELLKLGFAVAQSTVSKYMLRGPRPPSQGWKTFLRNQADGIAAVDFLLVPILTFERLFAFVILYLGLAGETSYGSALQPIRPRNGLPGRLPKPFHGIQRRNISSEILTGPMGSSSDVDFNQSVFVIARLRLGHHGKTDMSSGLSVRSGVNVSTTPSSGMPLIFGTSWMNTHVIITQRGPTLV